MEAQIIDQATRHAYTGISRAYCSWSSAYRNTSSQVDRDLATSRSRLAGGDLAALPC